jgi:hypothetical protein
VAVQQVGPDAGQGGPRQVGDGVAHVQGAEIGLEVAAEPVMKSGIRSVSLRLADKLLYIRPNASQGGPSWVSDGVAHAEGTEVGLEVVNRPAERERVNMSHLQKSRKSIGRSTSQGRPGCV